MTIDEAIKHCEEKAKQLEGYAEPYRSMGNCEKCAEEHRRLAGWLKDYKRLLEQQPCEDCISREPFMDSTICEGISCDKCSFNRKDKGGCILEERVMKLPSVTPRPKTGHCKDCRWWKDSDGLYRRGGHAESQCPINRREVFEGNGYCYMFEPYKAESEDKE